MATELKAPKGMFRVVGVDTFSHEDWVELDHYNREAALAHAKMKGSVMNKMHVYDDHGSHIGEAGSY